MKKLTKFLILIILVLFGVEFSQANLLKAQVEITDSEVKKRPLRLNLNYINTNDTLREVVVKLKTYTLEQSKKSKRKRKRWAPAENVIINLYLNEISKAGMLGSVSSDEDGLATFKLVNKFYAAKDTINEFIFKARVLQDPLYEDLEEEIIIQEGKILLIPFIKDSSKYLKTTVLKINDSAKFVPYEDADIRFFVQRDFGLLPLSDRNFSTDENGEVIIEFPFEIPGDQSGNIKILTRLEENEEFGLLSFILENQWGVPAEKIKAENDRALWASRSNAPIWLVVTVNLILFGIWLTIFYIVYQLFRIKKLA